MGKVSAGSNMPSFELKDQKGSLFQIGSVLDRKNFVICFYPKDDSPGCTKEAFAFRHQFKVFEDADALIIGINVQSVESHFNFAKKHNLNYTLLSDAGNKVRKLFGMPSNLFGLISRRVTYVVNKEGEVVFMFNSQIEVEKHVEEALRILNEIKRNHNKLENKNIDLKNL
jgi:thioredoxin-dependent peroxiredoxin